DNRGNSNVGNLSVNYNGDSGSVGMGYGYDSISRNVNASLSGGVLLHHNGVVLSQTLGDSVALISAPGVAGVKVASGNSSTNRWGYAASPYLQNYQRNMVSLDPTSLPDGAEIENTSINVYPTKGAVVEAQFKTRIGRQAMLFLNRQGKPVPFGAIVQLRTTHDDNSSIVGDNGMVYLSGLPQQGRLQVQWGLNDDQHCLVNYDLGNTSASSRRENTVNVVQQTLPCR
ncbi:fimbria/pilus outer membrane usher protein, partial [Enterobacteriaceae bacterium LUAb1]